ncbi:holin, partial [Melissococcus plutonius]
MVDINKMIQWMEDRKGKVTYSMENRYGPNSYDCSSAVYYSLIAGGFLPQQNIIGNTESLFNDLEKNGWQQLKASNGYFDTHRGDIFIWGDRGSTAGSAGHTGIFVDNDNIIHCNYGYNGITVNNHDTIWGHNGKPTINIYRYDNGNQPNPPKRRYGYRVDDLKVVNGVWQVRNNYLVPVDFDWTENGIMPEDLDKINPVDGSMHPNQVFKVGDYFAFNPACVLSVDTPVMVSGWQFMKVNLRHTGIIW